MQTNDTDQWSYCYIIIIIIIIGVQNNYYKDVVNDEAWNKSTSIYSLVYSPANGWLTHERGGTFET